jgi:hypothetical protein
LGNEIDLEAMPSLTSVAASLSTIRWHADETPEAVMKFAILARIRVDDGSTVDCSTTGVILSIAGSPDLVEMQLDAPL